MNCEQKNLHNTSETIVIWHFWKFLSSDFCTVYLVAHRHTKMHWIHRTQQSREDHQPKHSAQFITDCCMAWPEAWFGPHQTMQRHRQDFAWKDTWRLIIFSVALSLILYSFPISYSSNSKPYSLAEFVSENGTLVCKLTWTWRVLSSLSLIVINEKALRETQTMGTGRKVEPKNFARRIPLSRGCRTAKI